MGLYSSVEASQNQSSMATGGFKLLWREKIPTGQSFGTTGKVT